jgi:hypothetical protein
MIFHFGESTIEDAALAWLESLGCAGADGPNVAPEAAAEQITGRHA